MSEECEKKLSSIAETLKNIENLLSKSVSKKEEKVEKPYGHFNCLKKIVLIAIVVALLVFSFFVVKPEIEKLTSVNKTQETSVNISQSENSESISIIEKTPEKNVKLILFICYIVLLFFVICILFYLSFKNDDELRFAKLNELYNFRTTTKMFPNIANMFKEYETVIEEKDYEKNQSQKSKLAQQDTPSVGNNNDENTKPQKTTTEKKKNPRLELMKQYMNTLTEV